MSDAGIAKWIRPALLAAAFTLSLPALSSADAPGKVISVKDALAGTVPNQGPGPNPLDNPALAGLLQTGAKAYYLGQHSGMNGWLLMKNGQIQVGYIPVGNNEVIIGTLFGSNGQNETLGQIAALTDSNPEVADVMKNILSGKPQATAVPTSVTPASHPDSPGEKLLKEMAANSGVTLGSASAPLIYMIMDTNCPHCRRSWEQLRDSVLKGVIQLRLIPVATPNTESERSAAILLHAPDALNAWNKYTLQDKSLLVGTPVPGAVAAIRANHEMVDRWKIDATPYFVYRGKDGSVKIIKGEIEKADALLADVVP